MRQVPRYVIIGSGRLQHFGHYFHLLDIPFHQWSRRNDPALEKLSSVVQDCDQILLLISEFRTISFSFSL